MHGSIKIKIMRVLFKLLCISTLLLGMISCENESSEMQVQNLSPDEFATKTFEIFQDVSSRGIPKEDIRYSLFKDKDGFLNAKFEVVGETKKEIETGSFVQNETMVDDGTTCDGKWSCGKAINSCLKNGQAALITIGACVSQEYCVTCQD